MIGKKFGMLTALCSATGPRTLWFCVCDCRTFRLIQKYHLVREKVRTCGCSRKIGTRTTHGMRHTKIYSIWTSMLTRCRNPNYIESRLYSGRGITVCQRWESFENFYVDMGDPPDGMTLDRINNDGNYEPSNVRWATTKDQANNKRNNFIVSAFGLSLTAAQWADKTGLRGLTIIQRITSGWSHEDAVSFRSSALPRSRRTRDQV